jgi:excisionase family DNA binding protein
MTNCVQADRQTKSFAEAALRQIGDGPIALVGLPGGTELVVPPVVAAVLREMLNTLARGENVQLEPTSDEMTPNEAAAYLNVSRPHVVKLLDERQIAFRLVGTHRRIPTPGLVAYKRLSRARMEQGLDSLVQLSEDIGLYDTEGPPPAKDTYRGKTVGSR